MTKQQFLAMSLPYGLKVTVTGKSNVSGEHIYTLYSAYSDTPVIEVVGESDFKTDKYKSICHPLSDLTKEIEHKGEKFVPTIKLGWNTVTLSFSASNIKMAINTLTLQEAQKLIEWHFDIAGLIEKGEAIDVNTLSENPY